MIDTEQPTYFEEVFNERLAGEYPNKIVGHQPWNLDYYKNVDIVTRLPSIVTDLHISVERYTNNLFKKFFKELPVNFRYPEKHYNFDKKIEFLRLMVENNFIQPFGMLHVTKQKDLNQPWVKFLRVVIPESTYIVAYFDEWKNADIWDLVYTQLDAPFECWVRHTESEEERRRIEHLNPTTKDELESLGFINYVTLNQLNPAIEGERNEFNH